MQNRVKAIPLISIASSSLTSSYQALNGPAGLPNACFMIRVNNGSSTSVTISFDGVNDADIFATNTSQIYPFQTNSLPSSHVALLPAGQIIYAKGTAGTGTFYISGYYV